MRNTVMLTGIFAMAVLLSAGAAFAHPHSGQTMVDGHSHTEITPLSGAIGIEKTTLLFNAPQDNTLPWGFVEGKIANHVDGYPVIIQIYRDGDAVHFAQADVGQDGAYEYKFRVLYSDGGETKRIFDGDYTVTVFKVVYLGSESA